MDIGLEFVLRWLVLVLYTIVCICMNVGNFEVNSWYKL